MGAGKDLWMDKVEEYKEQYVLSDRLPDDFDLAVRRLVSLGFDRQEAADMLQEASA
jgi:hypothetical protein